MDIIKYKRREINCVCSRAIQCEKLEHTWRDINLFLDVEWFCIFLLILPRVFRFSYKIDFHRSNSIQYCSKFEFSIMIFKSARKGYLSLKKIV